MIKSGWVPSASACQKKKRGCLFFFIALYSCCFFWVEEGWMLFQLLPLPEVLWNRTPAALCFIGAKSPGEPEFVSHVSRKDYPSKVQIDLERAPTSQVHRFPHFPYWAVKKPRKHVNYRQRKPSKPAGEASSLGSCLTSLTAKVLLRNLSITVWVIFFPVEKFAVRNFQPALLCAATAAPNGKAKMAQRASHREGAGPWETWHCSRSAVLAATTQPRMHFRNVRCSLQNYVCVFTLVWPPKQRVCLARDFKGFCATL